MQMLRTLQLAALLVALALLSGCANTAAKRTETGLELNLVAKDNEGFVILKVVSVRPISLLNPKWQSVEISTKGKHAEMKDITAQYNMLLGKHVPTESLYFAKLEAGEYEITGMGCMGPGPGLLLALLASDSASTNRKLPRFAVQPGRLANLGTLVYVPEIEKERAEQMFLLHGPAGKKAAKNALLFESLRTDIPVIEGGGWTSAATAEAEADVLEQARRHVSLLSIQSTGQQVSAGSHLGQIFRRTGPQKWSRETIDTLGRVYSVAQAPDGRVIAGSDYGEYFVKAGNGKWSTYRLAPETGRIAHIEPLANGSAIFVAGDLQQTRVWKKKSIEDNSESPTEVTRTNTPPDNILVTDNELIFAGNIPGITRKTVISRINKQTLALTSQNENFWVVDWKYRPDGTVAMTRQNGLSLYSSTWVDQQRTWQHSDVTGITGYCHDTQQCVSIEASPGFTMVSNQLRQTSDGGTTWARVGKPLDTRNYAGRVVFADEKEVLLQGSDMLYSTTDNGATWQRLFPLPTSQ